MRTPTITRKPRARRAWAPLVAAIVGLGLGGAPARAAGPLTGISVVSVADDPDHIGADLAQARVLGARLVRFELPWAWLEPTAAGERDPARLARVDAAMARARALGLRVVLLVDRTPCWTSTAPTPAACGPDGSAYPPADTKAYAHLMAFLAVRYADALSGLEVWNEPDQANERYWAGPDKVKRYVALLKATYPAVKAAAPKVPVLGGAFVGTDGRWLKALYADGAKGFYDGLSVHFYDLGLLGLRTTRAVQQAHGDRAPLWLLETGWNSCAPRKRGAEGQPCVTRSVQATDLRDLYAQTAHTTWLRAVVIYKLRDDALDKFGLLTTVGARKASFAGLQRSWLQGPGRPSGLVVAVHARRGALRISASGPDGDVYELSVSRAGALRYRNVFRLSSTNRFSIALPAVLGTRGLVVRIVQPWSGTTVTRRT